MNDNVYSAGEQKATAKLTWRFVLMALAAAVFMLLMLAATSIVTMAHREAGREAQRLPHRAEKSSSTDLFLIYGFDSWNNKDYSVAWVEPAGNSKPVLPPGMNKLPKPGEAIVSPALDRLASQEPDLAARYPNRSVLGTEGVRSGDELFAYVRIQGDRTLDEIRSAARASGFGPSFGDEHSSDAGPLSTSKLGAITSAVTVGILGFLVLPGLVVLTVGLVTALGFHNESYRRWPSTGAFEWRTALIRVLKVSLLALPGLVLATVIWGLVSPGLERVPLVEHGVLRGDLQVPWWLLLIELVAGVALIGLLTLAIIVIAQFWLSRVTTRVWIIFREVIVTLHRIQLGVALVALALGYALLGPNPAIVFALGSIISAPLAFPGIFRTLGPQLVRLGSRSTSIRERIVEHSSFRATQPFVGVTALVVLAMTCAGYITLAQHVDQPSSMSTGETQAIFVNWVVPSPGDANRLANALDRGLVVTFRKTSHINEAHTLIVGGTCRQFAAYFPETSCKAGSPFELPNTTRQELANVLAPVTENSGTEIHLVPADKVGTSGNLVVIDDLPIEILENRVRNEAIRILPAPSFYSLLTTVLRPMPSLDWIVSGSVVVIIVLAIVCIMSLVDRFLVAHERTIPNTHNLRKGPASFEVCQFGILYCTAAFVGCVAGLISCTLLVSSSGVSMPWRGIGIVLAATMISGLVGALSVAIFCASKGSESSVDGGSDSS